MPNPARTLAIAGLLLAPLAVPVITPGAASAATDGTQVVISEVYGAGGNSGALYNRDFVELYNPADAAVNLDGLSVQYRSATGTSSPSGVVLLSGTVPGNGHFLLGLAGGANGVALPATVDQDNATVNLSGSAGTVFLANQKTALPAPPTGSVTGDSQITDLVGYGTSNTFETVVAPAPGTTTSVSRSAVGDDSDNNGADLKAGPPSPQNTTSGDAGGCGGPATEQTIAQVQGTSGTSPFVCRNVTTSGVVTASYPTGGLKGFYVQTPGSGGDLPAGHDASDAVFVYLGSQTAYPAIGDHVQVTAPVSEFNGLTELSPAVGGVTTLADAAAAPVPVTDPYPATDAGREAEEGMLQAPSGDFTVSDVFTLNNFGEIDLASGTTPLRQPTDVDRPRSAAAQAVADDNAARAVTLDDGSSTNYLSAANAGQPLPWITRDTPVRVGAVTHFTKPVVLDYRNDLWKFQPTSQLTTANAFTVQPVTFPNTRTAAPEHVDGDLKIASFNVLNFFTETGQAYAAEGHTCTSFKDRTSEPVTVNDCGPDGPRGAWDDADRQRQLDKEVRAINSLGADVLSLEEIENSAKYDGPENRDVALATLVTALNADAGAEVWSFVPSPAVADQPALVEQDVIRTAFIYKNAKAEPVGPSYVLTGSDTFASAREPLGQVFKPLGGAASQEFLAVVNHFKSKGSGSGPDADQGDGQGASNATRVAEAKALVGFVDDLKTRTGVGKVFLTGDFNSYTKEDPLQALYDAGYTDVGAARSPSEYTYVFDGLVGSLDHVLVNDEALATVRDAHVWNINSVESVAYEYSRHNYNATDFYAPDAYRSSDHDPTLVGFTIPAPPKATTTTATIAPREPGVRSPTTVTATVKADHGSSAEAGTVEVYDGKTLIGTGDVVAGTAEVSVQFTTMGQRTLTVRYLGTPAFLPSETAFTVRVRQKPKG